MFTLSRKECEICLQKKLGKYPSIYFVWFQWMMGNWKQDQLPGRIVSTSFLTIIKGSRIDISVHLSFIIGCIRLSSFDGGFFFECLSSYICMKIQQSTRNEVSDTVYYAQMKNSYYICLFITCRTLIRFCAQNYFGRYCKHKILRNFSRPTFICRRSFIV